MGITVIPPFLQFQDTHRNLDFQKKFRLNTIGPTGPATFLLVLPIFLKYIKKKTLNKIHRQHYLLFISSSFISKTFDILEGKLVSKNVPKCLLAL